jgi:septal ring factor EnvC (AmiA/AmiB activator)
MTTQTQLTEALAQKEAVKTSLSQAQQRLEEIAQLLTDPSSNAPELSAERRLLTDSVEVFETQLKAIATQITSLERQLVTESKAARKVELEAFLAGWVRWPPKTGQGHKL